MQSSLSAVCKILSRSIVYTNLFGGMVKPPVSAEPVLTGTRKTLVQQQGEVTVKDPSTHASRQVRELDRFAGAMTAKKKACLEQTERDQKELMYLDSRIAHEAKKYAGLREGLRFRCAERDRLRNYLLKCSKNNSSLMGEASTRTGWVRREDSKMLKSVSSVELKVARGYGSGPGTTFCPRKRARSTGNSGSAQMLPPLGGGTSGGRGMTHSISAPALRR